MIVDANVVVSATLGRSHALLLAIFDHGIALWIPAHQFREVKLVVTRIALQRGLDHRKLLHWVDAIIIPIPVDLYAGFETDARARLGTGGQKDWPLLALALASGQEIWSNDVDLFGIGVAVWNTKNIGKAAVQRSDAARQDGTNDA